jgi:hypothetical protein
MAPNERENSPRDCKAKETPKAVKMTAFFSKKGHQLKADALILIIYPTSTNF